MKRNDFVIVISVMLIAFIWWFVQDCLLKKDGSEIVVSQNGEIIGTYSLFEDTELVFDAAEGGCNHLVIQNGQASMSEADCPDKLCVKQKAISKNGESIICLPHQLVIEVRGGQAAEVDVIVR